MRFLFADILLVLLATSFLIGCTYAISKPLEIECVPIKSCPIALRLIEKNPYHLETVNFLKNAHCGENERDPKVWCTLFTFCKTPDDETGVCKDITECKSINNLLKTVDTSLQLVRQYFQSLRCNSKYDTNIKVCCPEESYTISTDLPEPDGLQERFSDNLPNPHLQECGTMNNDNKIFGGTATNLDEFPWMALFQYKNRNGFQYACGGSLISSRYVLTAAHCVDSYILKTKRLGKLHKIILGEYDVRNKTDCIRNGFGVECNNPAQEFSVKSIKMYPNYTSKAVMYDIALIELDRKVIFTDFIRPICLPQKSFALSEKDIFTIAGWGKTQTEKMSPVKRKTRIQYVDREKCNQYDRKNLEETQICAGKGDGKDTCFGDSGGPLMLERNLDNNYITFVAGVVSYGYGKKCGTTPAVYTSVPYYVDWIHENIEEHES